MTAPGFEIRLPTILSNYSLADIYNADEYGLFYQALPSKTLDFKKEKCVGRTFSKERLTGLVPGNALSQKLPIFIIGKEYKPRYLKNLKHLPCHHRGQKKVGWTVIYLKIGSVNRITSLRAKTGKSC